MAFDVNAALQAGASEDDVLSHLSESRKFDVQGALQAGASKRQVIDHMASMNPKSGFLGRIGENITGLKDLAVGAVTEPRKTAKSLLTPDPTVAKEAADAFNRGDYGRAAASTVEDIPLVGPMIRRAEQDIRNEDYGAMAGDVATGVALGKVPGLVKKIPGVSAVTKMAGDIARDPLGYQIVDPAARAAKLESMGVPAEAPPQPAPGTAGPSRLRRAFNAYKTVDKLTDKFKPKKIVEAGVDKAIDLLDGDPDAPKPPAPPAVPADALKPPPPPPPASVARSLSQQPQPPRSGAPPVEPDYVMPPPAPPADVTPATGGPRLAPRPAMPPPSFPEPEAPPAAAPPAKPPSAPKRTRAKVVTLPPPEPTMPVNPYEAAGRASKVANIAKYLHENGVTHDVVRQLLNESDPAAVKNFLDLAAKQAGEKAMSEKSVPDMLIELKKLGGKTKLAKMSSKAAQAAVDLDAEMSADDPLGIR